MLNKLIKLRNSKFKITQKNTSRYFPTKQRNAVCLSGPSRDKANVIDHVSLIVPSN